jgi:Na+-translocating ferredoxin:NAD+ oxidoreductase RnfE subunit
VLLLVLLELSDILRIKLIYKNAMQVFMSCACSLTAAAHIINIAVTRRMISDGVNVPIYFQIGYWPSVEMAVDYLAWGFFCRSCFPVFCFFI